MGLFHNNVEEHFKAVFAHTHIKDLVRYEADLSKFIDSDFFNGFILQDEILVIYDLVRDECVNRCRISSGIKD